MQTLHLGDVAGGECDRETDCDDNRPPQPDGSGAALRGTGTGAQMQCYRRFIENRADWRDRLPAYYECLGQ